MIFWDGKKHIKINFILFARCIYVLNDTAIEGNLINVHQSKFFSTWMAG